MTSIAATAAELRSIASSAPDASGYFPAMYAVVTDRIAAAIDDGRFGNGARMDRFATTFARLYTAAWRERGPTPRCWGACWSVAGDADLLIVQQLLLGINAHVNHDLPIAVSEVAGDGDIDAVRQDFDAVNDILAEAYVDVLRRLDGATRWTNRVAAAGGGRLFNFSLRAARDQAWTSAVWLHALPDETSRQAYLLELDRLVSVLAYLVTEPPAVVRPLLWAARRLEDQDPPAVTRRLLNGPNP